MQQASILIKPASSNCNMDCGYCFYKCLSSSREKYSLGFMSEATLELLIKNAIEYTDEYLCFAFQGGEPTLIGIEFYRKAVQLQKKYQKLKPKLVIENTIQTNGTTLNEEWCQFLHDKKFLVGLSLDGPKKIHDSSRKMADGSDSFYRIMEAVKLLNKYDVSFNILIVVTEQSASKASALYKFCSRNHFQYIQLVPCMDEPNRRNTFGKKTENPYAVKANTYGKFLVEFFDLWYEDFKKGNIMDVRMFSNLAQMAVDFPPEECGMCGKCNCYFVVEGDGTVYPCDFYCLDEYRLGNISDGFSKLKESQKAIEFENDSVKKPDECYSCEYYRFCRGGCRRYREEAGGTLGLHSMCEAYKMFYHHTQDRLFKLGQTIIVPNARKLL